MSKRQSMLAMKYSGDYHNGFVLPYGEDCLEMEKMEDEGIFISKVIGSTRMISFNYNSSDIEKIASRKRKESVRDLKVKRKRLTKELRRAIALVESLEGEIVKARYDMVIAKKTKPIFTADV